jgi:hypothetical protein
MTQKPKSLIRNQPDALAKLCLRHGERVLRAIRSKKAHRSENLKVRLVEYYVSLQGNWDRDQEKKDWKSHDLASLKYETYRFMIRILAQIGDGHNSDLYTEIKEISSALHLGATSLAFEISNSAAEVAIEREEYSLAIHILDLQAEILDELEVSSVTSNALVINQALRLDAANRLHEVQMWCELRRNLIEPTKRLWVDEGRVPMERYPEILETFTDISKNQPLSPLARCDYWALRILAALMCNDLAKAETYIKQLLNEYEVYSILKDRHRKRYVSHLRSSIFLFAQIGKEHEAKKLLSILHALSEENHPLASEAGTSWLFSALKVSYHFGDEALFRKAMDALEKGMGSALERKSEEGDSARLEWLILLNHLELGQFSPAYRVGMKLIAKKTTIRKTTIVSTRLAIFACEVVLFPDDEERIEGSYKATYQFIDRNKVGFSAAFRVLKAFRNIWSSRNRLGEIEMLGDDEFPKENIYDFSGLYRQVEAVLKDHLRSQGLLPHPPR